ncbi:MAG: glycoside hydrolase family 2 TIM barrel-domain containing protein [Bryobacteraceae bacterium]
MIHKSFLLISLLAAATAMKSAEPVRERRNFDDGWKFHLGDVRGAEQPAVDDTAWRKLRLPHDWSIEGAYSTANGSGTGFLPGGIGWYRKTFQLGESLRGRRVFLAFDGVYRDSDVWINGHLMGHRPYGYSSFEYELTPHLHFGAAPNIAAVRVDHSVAADSRFYAGSGIYRHVWLTVTAPVHVAHWGTYVYTPVIGENQALVSIETTVINQSVAEAAVQLTTSIEDPTGREVATVSTNSRLAAGASHVFPQQTATPSPMLWRLDEPNLYTAVTRVFVSGTLADEVRAPFGIRSIRFDRDRGFFLNGVPLKLKGVCLHHDLGALGAAFSEAALERRLRLLKVLGVNAIRCSHNPMAPQEYDLCDRLGLLVMDEAFDEWTGGKHKWIQGWNAGTPGTRGYHEVFDEWADRDLADMVLRDRNHPSIVLWSIGNEIDYPGDPFGHPLGRDGLQPGMRDAAELVPTARRLVADVKRLDGTRPVTQALADTLASNATGLASLLDAAGYNYLEQYYSRDHLTYPNRVIYGSENSHSLAAWRAVAENDYVAGQFLWTGVDYLGEAARYPSRGSAAGLLDLCGLRKPIAYFRQALWSDRPMVYVAAREAGAVDSPSGRPAPPVEHWNWAGDARTAIPVEVYTNCASVELFLNGRSLGEKPVADRLDPVLHWDVPNQPGVVRAVGKRDSREVVRFELATAGAPHRIELTPDRTALAAGGQDLSHVAIQIVDAEGRRVCQAGVTVEVEATGAGELATLDTGDLTDLSPVRSNHRKTYQGRALAIVRAGDAPGRIALSVSAPGLPSAKLEIAVK